MSLPALHAHHSLFSRLASATASLECIPLISATISLAQCRKVTRIEVHTLAEGLQVSGYTAVHLNAYNDLFEDFEAKKKISCSIAVCRTSSELGKREGMRQRVDLYMDTAFVMYCLIISNLAKFGLLITAGHCRCSNIWQNCFNAAIQAPSKHFLLSAFFFLQHFHLKERRAGVIKYSDILKLMLCKRCLCFT